MRFFITALLTACFHIMSQSGQVVNVYHYLDKGMGHPANGVQSCEGNDNLICEWHSSRDMNLLHDFLQNDTEKFWRSNHNMETNFNDNDTYNNASRFIRRRHLTATNDNNLLTVFVANIHQWLYDGHTIPNLCTFPVNLTMADTEGE